MLATDEPCTGCGSRRTASRRQLFHWLMNGAVLPRYFRWYSVEEPGAMPPKSLFVLLLLLLLGMTLPFAGLWLLGHYLALRWLSVLLLLVLAALLVDVLATYRRYRQWGVQWLCGECHATFIPASSTAP